MPLNEIRDSHVSEDAFKVRDRVRVDEEDLIHNARFGEYGVITEVNGAERSVSVLFEKITSLSAVSMPMSILGLRPAREVGRRVGG